MNREIKFRAWDKKDKVVRDVVGMSFYHESEFEIKAKEETE